MTHLKVLVTPGAPVLIESETVPVDFPSDDDAQESGGIDYYDEYSTSARRSRRSA